MDTVPSGIYLTGLGDSGLSRLMEQYGCQEEAITICILQMRRPRLRKRKPSLSLPSPTPEKDAWELGPIGGPGDGEQSIPARLPAERVAC